MGWALTHGEEQDEEEPGGEAVHGGGADSGRSWPWEAEEEAFWLDYRLGPFAAAAAAGTRLCCVGLWVGIAAI